MAWFIINTTLKFIATAHFCTLLALCPPAVPPADDKSRSGGGGANIAVIGTLAMTSVSMSLICIPESPVYAANDTIICMHVQEGHSFLLTAAVIILIVVIVAIAIAVAVCVWQRGSCKCKGRHNGYLPFRSCILSAMVCPV